MTVTAISATRQRASGAYYTPASTADYMADWVLRANDDEVLEPSFGDGVFLRALGQAAKKWDLPGVRVRGVELDEEARAKTISAGLIESADAVHGDFLAQTPFLVDAVIGNPPYVRIRHLESPEARDTALRAASSALPQPIEPSGSIWMPFVLHATSCLRIGGRLALVLPYELTYVRYAKPLWRFLGERFSSLRVVRVFERVFPDILQEVVLLFADGHGGHTDHVDFEVYSGVDNLLFGDIDRSNRSEIQRIVAGERDFVMSLLSPELQALLKERLIHLTRPARETIKFNIGYVAGDKQFFHPDAAARRSFALPCRSLKATLTSSRSLRGTGLRTSQLDGLDVLFLPSHPEHLTEGEHRYVISGEQAHVSERYKCRVRTPWYVVPGVLEPDVVVSVFSSTPLLMLNDAGAAASNSLLCGYVHPGVDAERLTASWYMTLTLQECELRVHSLGGGVLIMIPGEAGSIRLPTTRCSDHLVAVDECLRRGDIRGAYAAGDDLVLRRELGLSEHEIELLHEGVQTLTMWREKSV